MSQINKKLIKISFLKGSGPGGQNRNKRMSGVRVEHLPTGIKVMATERRSQSQNLATALERLQHKIDRYLFKPKTRKKSTPSKKTVENRISKKKIHSKKKALRSNKINQWD